MKTKIKKWVFNGFGFPIELHNVAAREVRGSLEPVINYKDLAKKVISEICSDENEAPLTGRQVFFLRSHLGMTIRDFGTFVDATHAAVKKWENNKDKATQMTAPMEKMLRLKVLEKTGIKATEFFVTFKNMKIDRDKHATNTMIQITM
jgi:DNA-binding transcriptional regulator YiaG